MTPRLRALSDFSIFLDTDLLNWGLFSKITSPKFHTLSSFRQVSSAGDANEATKKIAVYLSSLGF